jgi:hypothetical protein
VTSTQLFYGQIPTPAKLNVLVRQAMMDRTRGHGMVRRRSNSAAATARKRSQIVPHSVPDQFLIHGIVFVPVDVASGGDRRSSSGCWLLVSGGSRREASDTISGAWTTAYTVFRSAANTATSIPVVNTSMASTLSMMSRRRWAGLLEGMDGIAQDAIAE